jgi:hypothetical protein
MRRVASRCTMVALAFLLLGGMLFAQVPATFDWNAGLRTIGMLSDPGTGIEGDWQDALSLDVELAHGAGRGLMTYRLAGQLQYTPQLIAPDALPITAITGFPTESGISFELPPKNLIGLWFRATLGRVALSDPSGLLFFDPDSFVPGQLVDGLLVEFRFQGFYAAAGAGYLGFLDKRLNRIRLTPQDENELVSSSFYYAPPRGLAIVRAEVENLFAGQRAGFFAVGQKDFRAETPTFDSWYIGAEVSGPIALGFRHESTLITAITVPSASTVGVGVLLDEVLAYRIPVSFLHEAWLSLLWASSDLGSLAAFPALAGPLVGGDLQEPLSDIARIELGIDASFPAAPAGAILTPALAGRLLFRPSGQAPAGYAQGLAGSYLGTEVELSAALEPVKGLRFRARGGTLIAPTDVMPYVRLDAGVSL